MFKNNRKLNLIGLGFSNNLVTAVFISLWRGLHDGVSILFIPKAASKSGDF
jgi:hypothetical protein